MSETADIVITVEKRTEAGKSAVRKLRREGKVPAVLYGADKESVALSDHLPQLAVFQST